MFLGRISAPQQSGSDACAASAADAGRSGAGESGGSVRG